MIVSSFNGRTHESLQNSCFLVPFFRANRMAITSGDKVFYYQTRDSLCFLTLTEAKYPKRLAFLYLDEVCDIVLQELLQEFGGNVSSSNNTKTSKSMKPFF